MSNVRVIMSCIHFAIEYIHYFFMFPSAPKTALTDSVVAKPPDFWAGSMKKGDAFLDRHLTLRDLKTKIHKFD